MRHSFISLRQHLSGLRQAAQRRLGYSTLSVVIHPCLADALPAEVPVDRYRSERIFLAIAARSRLSKRQVLLPRQASIRQLLHAHDSDYLAAMEEPEALTRVFGSEMSQERVEGVLKLAREMVGGTVLACHAALRGNSPIAHLGGGFHHARRSQGAGFSVFNDVAVAIGSLREHGFSGRILVVDLDLHDGDGTREIFRADASVHSFSIHNDHWGETEAIESTSIELGADIDDEHFLGTLLKSLPKVFRRFEPELVIYLAGTDSHADDTLGNWNLSDEGLMTRDRLVTELCRLHNRTLPLVVLLAGGYGHNAWRPSARYLTWLATGEEHPPPAPAELTKIRSRAFGLIAEPVESSDGSWIEFSEEDLAALGYPVQASARLFDRLGLHGVELALERARLLQGLRRLGFEPEVKLEAPPSGGWRIRLESEEHELLVETQLDVEKRRLDGRQLDLAHLEWLLMQNPRRDFSERRPRLSGQAHPGLGLLAEAFDFLVIVVEEAHLDGVVFTASEPHVAWLCREVAMGLDKNFDILLRELDAQGLDLLEGTAALRCDWRAQEMVLPVSALALELTAKVLQPQSEE